MIITTAHDIGDIVYLLTDNDQNKRVITQMNIRPNNTVMYDLSCGSTSSWHYEFEISTDKDFKQS